MGNGLPAITEITDNTLHPCVLDRKPHMNGIELWASVRVSFFLFYLWRNPMWESTARVKRSRKTSPFSALGPKNHAPRAAHCLCLSTTWSPLENTFRPWEYIGALARRGRFATVVASCWVGLFRRAENMAESVSWEKERFINWIRTLNSKVYAKRKR